MFGMSLNIASTRSSIKSLDITVSLVMQSVSTFFGDISGTDVAEMANFADTHKQYWRLPPDSCNFADFPTADRVGQHEELAKYVQANNNAYFVYHHNGWFDKKKSTYHIGMLSRSDLPSSNKRLGSMRKMFFPHITWVTDSAIVDSSHIPKTDGVLCPQYLPFLFVDFMRLKEGENVFMNYARIHVTFHPKAGRARAERLKSVLISDI